MDMILRRSDGEHMTCRDYWGVSNEPELYDSATLVPSHQRVTQYSPDIPVSFTAWTDNHRCKE